MFHVEKEQNGSIFKVQFETKIEIPNKIDKKDETFCFSVLSYIFALEP
jgi:hypothetical protein